MKRRILTGMLPAPPVCPGGDGSQGYSGCGLCPEVEPATWGRIKTLYH